MSAPGADEEAGALIATLETAAPPRSREVEIEIEIEIEIERAKARSAKRFSVAR